MKSAHCVLHSVHQAAERGFGQGAQTYARGRPDYPAELAGWLRDYLHLAPGRTALDLGAGTGKFLPLLLGSGAQVGAVEPVAAMRALLAEHHPQVPAIPGTAEAIPLPDAGLDAVVCAQAFHWFATPAALAEIHRVLKPGGALGLVWNVRDERVPWVAALTRIIDAHQRDEPRYASGRWREVFPADGFGPLVEQQFTHVHRGPAADVIVARSLSISFIAAMPAAKQAEVEAQLRALIASEPDLAGRDEVSFPYQTFACHCRRLD